MKTQPEFDIRESIRQNVIIITNACFDIDCRFPKWKIEHKKYDTRVVGFLSSWRRKIVRESVFSCWNGLIDPYLTLSIPVYMRSVQLCNLQFCKWIKRSERCITPLNVSRQWLFVLLCWMYVCIMVKVKLSIKLFTLSCRLLNWLMHMMICFAILNCKNTILYIFNHISWIWYS